MRLRWGPFGVDIADRKEAKMVLGEHMVQARTLVIKLYYSSWKSVLFVPAKDQLSELVSYLLEAPQSSGKR